MSTALTDLRGEAETETPPLPAIAGVLIVALVCAVLFRLFPGIDIWFSGLFYAPGEGFFLADSVFARAFEEGISAATPIVAIALVVVIVVSLLPRFAHLARFRAPALLVLATLAVGTGLAGNAIFKDNWGRARPNRTTEFGGTQRFTPAFVMTSQCRRNCSFVAGHPAAVFALFGAALLLRRRRRTAIAAVAAFGALAGLGRIMQGKHFLSDVVFAGFVVYIVAWGLAWAYRRVMASHAIRGSPWIKRLEARVEAIADPRPGASRVPLIAAGVVAVAAILYLLVDRPLALFIKADLSSLEPVFEFISRFGYSTPWLVGSALLAVLLWLGARGADGARKARYRRGWQRAVFFFAGIAAAGLLNNLLKIVFGRMRPKLLFSDDAYGFTFFHFHPDYWSFPSGHATNMAAIAVALYFLWPRYRWVYLAAAAVMALARVMQTVHYASDVVVGAALAAYVVVLVRLWFERRGFDIFAAPVPAGFGHGLGLGLGHKLGREPRGAGSARAKRSPGGRRSPGAAQRGEGADR
jgi:lipid A 4'-phosphatase